MKIFTTKRAIYFGISLLILLAVIAVIAVVKKGKALDTQVVLQGDLKKTVLATGQVISDTDVDLSFKNPGLVEQVNVKVGDRVEAGDVLATLTQRDQLASVTQARGSVAQAQANYSKVIAGADTPEVNIAKQSVASAEVAYKNAFASFNSAKFQQDGLVRNAQLALFNSSLVALRPEINTQEPGVTISGAYQGELSGEYRVELKYIGTGYKVAYEGVESGVGTQNVKRGIAAPLGTKGLYITFSDEGVLSGGVVWKVEIPNTQASNYLTNLNAYNSAVQTRDVTLLTQQNTLNSAEANLNQAKASLDQVLAEARPEDVAVAQAQILSAQGQLEGALAALENTIIRAPGGGTITAVNIDKGEQTQTGQAAIVLKDLENLYIEANIAEANIGELKLDQPVEIDFDALGSSQKFSSKVVTIDPASTLVAGIVNYKIKVSIAKTEQIRPGMTANLEVIIAERKNVVIAPQSALSKSGDSQVVTVVTDANKRQTAERLVEVGLIGNGGQVEIKSGLEVGQEVVIISE
ncbi:MAG: efflux RND transporter periplasmic adaptor subunit [Candidatus Doudnabacteria bacterium]